MTTVAIVLIVSVFAFAVLGVPLAWSLGLSSLCAILTTGTISLGMLAQRMYTGGAVYAFLAIFFFIFAGNIMTYGGLSKRLIRFANGLVGHHTGGTSIVCTLACTFFAAISGSSIATTAAIGGMLYPELKDYGYPDDYMIQLVPHMWGTGIGVAAGLQFIANIPATPLALFPDEPMIEYDLSENLLRDTLIGKTIKIENGTVKIPHGSGLGIKVDRNVIERFLMK